MWVGCKSRSQQCQQYMYQLNVVSYLGNKFGLHPLTIEDCTSQDTREKLEIFKRVCSVRDQVPSARYSMVQRSSLRRHLCFLLTRYEKLHTFISCQRHFQILLVLSPSVLHLNVCKRFLYSC